jgi:hypothetical protein
MFLVKSLCTVDNFQTQLKSIQGEPRKKCTKKNNFNKQYLNKYRQYFVELSPIWIFPNV